jgi:hypothetical protein
MINPLILGKKRYVRNGKTKINIILVKKKHRKYKVVHHNLLLIKCRYILTCTMPQVTFEEPDQVGT